MSDSVVVLGAGLAGSEAAWQLAEAGVDVEDEELEQEFMETMGLESEEETAPLIPQAPVRAETVVVPPPRELALPAMMS